MGDQREYCRGFCDVLHAQSISIIVGRADNGSPIPAAAWSLDTTISSTCTLRTPVSHSQGFAGPLRGQKSASLRVLASQTTGEVALIDMELAQKRPVLNEFSVLPSSHSC